MGETDTRDPGSIPGSVVEAPRGIQKEVARDDREQEQGGGSRASRTPRPGWCRI